jgi:hypothetical protein
MLTERGSAAGTFVSKAGPWDDLHDEDLPNGSLPALLSGLADSY